MSIDRSGVRGFLDLRNLAIYASCSVRWLRNRLTDRNRPLPHYRIEGKVLVRREEFDEWVATFRVVMPANELDQIVESVVAQVRPSKRVA